MNPTIEFRLARVRLATIWYTFTTLLLIIFFIQTILGRYGDAVESAWAWLIPTVVPSLSLITGSLVIDFKKISGKAKKADRFLFRLAFCLSIGYLLAVCLTVLSSPFAEQYAQISVIDLFNLSQLWLGPFQGLVAASLGAFFVKT